MPEAARPSAPEDSRRAVANRLHSAAIHLLRHLRRTDAETGLSPARLSLLSLLVFGGPATVSDLARAEQVSAPTVSRLVSVLEREGLVERRADVHDGRVVHVVATSEGARLLLAARRERVERLAAALAELDTGALRTLADAAEIMEEVFE